MDTGQLTHLLMTRYSVAQDGTIKLDNAVTFTAQINPSEFRHSYGVRYDGQTTQGGLGTDPKFSTMELEKVGFTIVLDGTGVVPSPNNKPVDLKLQIARLNRVVYEYVPQENEPPHVRLLWGTLIFFGRLESMTTQYTLFKPSGEPLRARIELGFKGAMSKKEGKLVSNQQSGVGRIAVREGDTLASVCARHYRDSSDRLATVARANNLDSLLQVRPGTELTMPTEKV
ncbi:LysM peptidoglycan-binding domain-containing protein [Pseudorhodoferax soli]|uniref:Contractile injection system tube protein N-terminal domain-containing protein n=1 Tax=Pseudorhodoferax soli TaxID=545864 RepID=A0A368Y8M7_9BURK|nr:LysM peptidoglycan-binding domain-containing protein [Pseudorhodoferax soli]RCW76455.1 hypothetical protein DES41_1011061 [Pseudorhodoferax soli]